MDALARALGAGLLLALAFPPLGWWGLAWIAPGLLYLGFTSPPSPRPAGGVRGGCFGGALFLLGASWVRELAWALWPALLVFPGALFVLYGAVNGALLPRLPRVARPTAFALGWALFEWLRSLGLYATPWFTLASAHAPPTALPLLQCVSLIGGYGFGFLIALTSALLAEGVAQRRAAYGLALLIPALLLLFFPMPAPKAPPARLALLQAGRADSHAWERYVELTRQAATNHPNCIVWPEGAGTELGRSGLAALAKDVQTPLLVGLYETGSEGRPWNRALLFDSKGTLIGSYAKQRLAPFGEVYPLQKWLGGIYAGFGIHHGSYWAGEEPGVLTLPTGQKLGIGICFESAFPWVARQSVQQGAEVLVFLTSDQTFAQSAELAQHRDQAVVRAVENRRPTVQAATTGLTVEIDSAGRVTSR